MARDLKIDCACCILEAKIMQLGKVCTFSLFQELAQLFSKLFGFQCRQFHVN